MLHHITSEGQGVTVDSFVYSVLRLQNVFYQSTSAGVKSLYFISGCNHQ